MNPLSSFSFGKIIKTLIPGLIATLAPFFLFEGLYLVTQPVWAAGRIPLWTLLARHSFFCQVVLSESIRLTAFGAALVPVALTLGFFLNAALWMWVNRRFRAWVDRQLDPVLLQTRQALEQRAANAFAALVPGSTAPGSAFLQSFYLPLFDFEKLTFLSESYFSWYEFALNSAAALLLAGASYQMVLVLLAYQWSVPWSSVAVYVCVPLLAGLLLIWFLIVAAVRNLQRFQEQFVWFLAGTIHFYEAAQAARAAVPAAP